MLDLSKVFKGFYFGIIIGVIFCTISMFMTIVLYLLIGTDYIVFIGFIISLLVGIAVLHVYSFSNSDAFIFSLAFGYGIVPGLICEIFFADINGFNLPPLHTVFLSVAILEIFALFFSLIGKFIVGFLKNVLPNLKLDG